MNKKKGGGEGKKRRKGKEQRIDKGEGGHDTLRQSCAQAVVCLEVVAPELQELVAGRGAGPNLNLLVLPRSNEAVSR